MAAAHGLISWSRPGGRLFWKYVVIFAILVSGALLTSGAVEIYFSYQENQAALASIQREKAVGAAARIEQFIGETERLVGGAVQSTAAVAPEQRRNDYLRLLRQAPAVTEVSYLDSSGKEQEKVSRLSMNLAASQVDYSSDPKFTEARARKTYFSPVYFRNESEPYMSLSVLESGPNLGVTVAEVNLKFIWDVVSQIQIGRAGVAYVVNSGGELVAHPDISLVLKKTSLAGLPQVSAGPGTVAEGSIGRDPQGRQVLAAAERVDPPGWTVLVEQPLDEAFAPLYASITRTAFLLLLGVGLAFLASLVLARKMVTPIRALQAGAARIGSGALDQRIDVHTGDELEALADQFNRMTSQLRDSYTTLEQKVEERTRDLTEALEQQTATGEVLRIISRSTFDLQPVLETLVENATRLCDGDKGFIFRLDGEAYRLAADYRASAEFRDFMHQNPIRPGRETMVGKTALERRVVHIPDVLDDPDFKWWESQRLAGFRTVLGVPMLREGEPIGVFALWRDEVKPFTDKQIELVTTFADQAVIAVQNVRLFQEIQDKSRQLEIASQHKSEFLANMSHELRTPLNAIIGFSEVLIERMFGELNEKQDEYLQDILSSGRHLLSLINDILDLSKVEAGRMELELDTFSLPAALQNGLTMIKERASRHGIMLGLEIDPGIDIVEADERKVKQVVFNLLSNAVKFTPDGGRVDLAARRTDGTIQIAVHDTGIGIATEDQERIFEEFRQASQGAAKTHEGTGLGLALASKFVELHGGRLWVESEVGVGSTFTFTLPSGPRESVLAAGEQFQAGPPPDAIGGPRTPKNGR